MFIDTHAHIYSDELLPNIDTIVSKCLEVGVDKIMMPNIDTSSVSKMNDLHEKYPDVCYPMIGIHPCYVQEDYRSQVKLVEQEAASRKYYGIGEVGIDLYWDKSLAKEQEAAFRYQISLAREHQLPIIIHSRDSLDLTISTISDMQNGDLKGIFHCFNGSVEQSKKVLDIGFLMGAGGVVTFKNAGLDKVYSQIPLEHVALETDAPYLTPTPHRGKTNHPYYIPIIAQKLADIHNINIEQIGNITSHTAKRLFGLKE